MLVAILGMKIYYMCIELTFINYITLACIIIIVIFASW
nr:MAG TPA: hypothetical protein [Caudoviricetes sp.]